jgi:hypothetical protein
MAKPITVRYTFTQKEFDTALPHFLRRQFRLILPFYVLMVALAVFLLIRGDWIVAVAIFVLSLLLFGVLFKLRVDSLRYFQMSPAKDAIITWAFRPSGIAVNIADKAQSDLAWDQLKQIKETPKGLLILPNNQSFFWLPYHGFRDEADINRLRKMASAHNLGF